ncbi:MAG: hypothetical protein V9H26_25765 [Verrucomicrobiota bacterium]
MSTFTSAKIPKWRIAFWGVLAIGAFAWVGHALGDRGMVWAGVICVPLLITLMLGIIRMGRSQWAKQHVGLLIGIYVVLQSALLIWRFFEKH